MSKTLCISNSPHFVNRIQKLLPNHTEMVSAELFDSLETIQKQTFDSIIIDFSSNLKLSHKIFETIEFSKNKFSRFFLFPASQEEVLKADQFCRKLGGKNFPIPFSDKKLSAEFLHQKSFRL